MHVNGENRLAAVLAAGHLAVTSECGPPRGADGEVITGKAKLLQGYVDAVNVTDNQTSVTRLCSLAACIHLKLMGVEESLRMEVDEEQATIAYCFPELAYPERDYRHNMGIIRSHPASMKEEVELKLTRIIMTLAAMLVGVFLLRLLRFPMPLPGLLVGFAVLAPIVSVLIWRRQGRAAEL